MRELQLKITWLLFFRTRCIIRKLFITAKIMNAEQRLLSLSLHTQFYLVAQSGQQFTTICDQKHMQDSRGKIIHYIQQLWAKQLPILQEAYYIFSQTLQLHCKVTLINMSQYIMSSLVCHLSVTQVYCKKHTAFIGNQLSISWFCMLGLFYDESRISRTNFLA